MKSSGIDAAMETSKFVNDMDDASVGDEELEDSELTETNRYPSDDDTIEWLADMLQLHQRVQTGEFSTTADKWDPSATACPSPTTSSLDSISMCDAMDDDKYWMTLSWLTSRGL